jgi:hypothetical protein
LEAWFSSILDKIPQYYPDLRVGLLVRAPPIAEQVGKIAAASRELDAAIRMFFAREDELAIHTVASAAFRILRDLTKKHGKDFTAEALRPGLYQMARLYANGELPKEMLKVSRFPSF